MRGKKNRKGDRPFEEIWPSGENISINDDILHVLRPTQRSLDAEDTKKKKKKKVFHIFSFESKRKENLE